MSTTVDQRVVSMQFDNKHFEQNVQTSISTIDKLKQSLNFNKASQGLDDFHNSTKNTLQKSQSEFESYRSGIFRIGDAINKMWSSMEYEFGGWIKRTAKALTIDPISQGFKEYETQIGAIQTILANTESKGSTLEDVNTALDELNAYADKTIYNFTEMTRNIGTFTAAGTDLDTSVKAIKGIANLAAVSGSTSQQASTAMYQLSQAMASGTVKLMDWNSVVNAGMGGQVFQDALKETAKVHGVKIDEIIAKQGSFRESLSEGWLTTEILTDTLEKFTLTAEEGTAEWDNLIQSLKAKGYTEEQAKEILKLGNTATDAATKVKTFTQLFDTLKEAAQSGWSQTWEIIVGDFEEAKAFLTEVSDTLGGLIGASAEARNELLSDWKTLGGRTDLLESIRNVFHGIMNILDPVKEAFTNIFPPLTAKQLVGFTRGLKNLTNTFKEFGEKHGNNIRRTFEGIFAVLSLGWEIIKGVVSAVGDFLSVTDDTAGGIFSITAAIGDVLVLVSELIKNTGIIKAVFRVIGSTFKLVVGFLSEIFKGVGLAFELTPLEAFQNFVMGISGKLNKFADSMDGVGKGIGNTFKNVMASIADMPIVKFLITTFGAVFNFIKKIGAAIGSFFNNTIDSIAESDLGDLLDFINTIIAGAAGGGLVVLIKNINELFKGATDIKEALGSLVEGFTDMISPLTDCFKALQSQIKANVISTIAKALLTLAIALVVIALIPQDKLYSSLAAIGALFAGLMISMNAFMKGMNGFMGSVKHFEFAYKSIKATLQMGGVMVKFATAILVLAVALKVLSTMSWDEIGRGLTAMGGCMVILMAAMKVLGKIPATGTMASEGAKQLIKISLALLLAVIPLKLLGSMEWEEIGRGLAGMAGALAIMVGAMAAMSKIRVTMTKISKSGKESNVSTMVKQSKQLIIMAGALLLVAIPIKMLGSMEWEAWGKGMLGITIALGAMVGAMALMSKIKAEGSAVRGATSMVIMASALLIIAQPLMLLSALNWGAMARAGVSMLGILGTLTAAQILLSKFGSGSVKGAAGAVILASTLVIVAQPLMLLSALNTEALKRGLVGMFGVLGLLVSAQLILNTFGSGSVKGAAGAVILASTLVIITSSLMALSALNWEALARGMVGMIGILGLLTTAQILLSNFGSGSVKGAAGVLILASSLSVLALGLTLLGLVPITSIVTGLMTLMGVFILMGTTVAILGPMVSGLLLLGQGFALVSVGLLAISVAALLLGPALIGVSAGLVALMNALGYVATMAPLVADALILLVSAAVTGLLKGVAEAIVAVCDLIADSAAGIAKALIAVLLAVIDLLVEVIPPLAEALMKILVGAVRYIAAHMAPLVQALMDLITGVIQGLADGIGPMIQAVADLFFKVIQGVIDALAGMKTADGLTDALLTCSILTLIVAELAAVALLTPFALVGALGLGAVVTELVAVLSAIGGLAQIPGIEWIVNEGGTLLKTLGDILNDTMGSLTSGFALLALLAPLTPLAAVSVAGIALVGTELVAALAILGGIASIPGIDWLMGKGGEFLSKLGNIIGNFVGSIIGGIGEGISASLPGIGTNLSTFMSNVSGFIEGAKVIDDTFVAGIDNLVSAMLKITGANVLDSLASFLTGQSTMKDFAGELKVLGTGMADFAKSMDGVDISLVEKGANAAKTLAEMTNAIPNTGGVVAWFTGENSICNFAGDLKHLGKGIAEFALSIGGADLSQVQAGANAAKTLAEMTSVIPNEGGITAWFAGENSISKFAYQLPTLGKGIAGFATAIGDADVSKISSAVTAGKALAEMTSVIPSEGGIKAWFSGEQSITKFAGDLPKLGEGLAGFGTKVAGINPEKIKAAASAAKSLGDMTSVIPTNTNKIKTFGDNLVDFGTDLNSFMSKVKGISADSTSNVSKAVKVIESIAKIDSGNIKSVARAIDDFSDSVADMAEDLKTDLKNAGKDAIDAFIKGVNDKLKDAEKACKSILDACVTALKSKYSEFEGAGKYVVEGFADGISKNTYMAEAKAKAMANAAKKAAEEALGIESPSKELYKDGRYTVLGFVNGISDYANRVYGAGYSVAETARDGFSEAISKIGSLVDSDMNLQPTVRPVLDLSNIQNGASSINDLFNTPVGVMSNINSIGTMMRGFNQNGANLEVVSAIDKLRKDLGNVGNTTYNVNGITYDDGSNISEAVQSLMRAARVERRI